MGAKSTRGIATGSHSDIGRRRQTNQDRVWVSKGMLSGLGVDAILVVADGMGGHAGGDIAAESAVSDFKRALGLERVQKGGVLQVLEDAAHGANKAVQEEGKRRGLEGMGTTFTALALAGTTGYLVHAGDSRAYLVRGEKVRQVSTDHSWVQEQVSAGLLKPEEARNHPSKNIVTRALGLQGPLEFQSKRFSLKGAQALILCSDGLSNNVEDAEIGAMAVEGSPQQACERLVDLANERGGQDNISVVIAHLGPGNLAEAEPKTEDIDTQKIRGNGRGPLLVRLFRFLMRR